MITSSTDPLNPFRRFLYFARRMESRSTLAKCAAKWKHQQKPPKPNKQVERALPCLERSLERQNGIVLLPIIPGSRPGSARSQQRSADRLTGSESVA